MNRAFEGLSSYAEFHLIDNSPDPDCSVILPDITPLAALQIHIVRDNHQPVAPRISFSVGSERADTLFGFPDDLQEPPIRITALGHFLLFPRGPSVFLPPNHCRAQSLKEPGHRYGQDSHCKQKGNAHIHDALLSPVENGNCPLQSFQLAKESRPLDAGGPACLSG